jgi:exosortase D (VPLPA-CTERM-specific)
MAALLFLTGLFAAFYGLRFLWRNKTAFIVLFFCIPLPPFVTKLLTFRLRLFSTHLAEIMMHQVGIPVFVEGNIIDLGIAQLQVVDACSGMRYFFPIIILTLVMTFVLRTGPLAKVLLLAASPVVAVVANAFRLLVIALGVHYIDRDIVNTPFHEGSGVIVYLVAGLTLLALHRLLRLVPLPGLRAREEDEQAARAARACRARALPVATGIVLAVIGVGLCAGSKAFVQTASKVEPIPLLKPFSEFPAQIGDWKIEQRIVLTSADLASLDCDAYVDVVFSNVKTGNRFYFLMTYYGEQRLSKTAHPPTSCLLGTGWLINGRRYVDHPGVPGFTFQQVLLERENVRLISNFWFIQRGDVIASEFKHRWRMLWDGVVKRRTHGALVRVEMPLLPRQTVQQGQDLLNSFTEQLTPVLREFIPE